jgi:hypothetical protein
VSDYEDERRPGGEVVATGRIQLDEEPEAGETLTLGRRNVRIDDVLHLGGRRRLILVDR